MNLSMIVSNILAHFSLQIFCNFLKLTVHLPSTIWTYFSSILTHNPFPFSAQIGSKELIKITRFEHKGGASEHCAVCLGEVEEGEEIGELKCSHIFHQVCLERWIQFKHTTCPLCRGSLARPLISAAAEADCGVEVLFFKFCSFRSDDDERDSWWLR